MTALAAHDTHASGVTFPRVLRSEWIKFTTVRSTVVLVATTVLVMIGLALLTALSAALVPAEVDASSLAFAVPSSGVTFGQLTIASLAVVIITSEWGTGMIRSTLVAVPDRTTALLAKATIIAIVSFVVGLVSALASYALAQPILEPEGLTYSLTEEGVLASVINSGIVLALVAIISFSIGALLRSTAAGVVTAIGVFFVLPIILTLLSGVADWISDVARFLPADAAAQLVAVSTEEGALTPLQGGVTMAAWALVLLVIAVVVTRRRDV